MAKQNKRKFINLSKDEIEITLWFFQKSFIIVAFGIIITAIVFHFAFSSMINMLVVDAEHKIIDIARIFSIISVIILFLMSFILFVVMQITLKTTEKAFS